MPNRKIRPQNIMRPYREQDNFVYTRLHRGEVKMLEYDDTLNGSRIISSKRVEEAMETADFLKVCREEGLSVVFHANGVVAVAEGDASSAISGGSSLRQAYFRLRNI